MFKFCISGRIMTTNVISIYERTGLDSNNDPCVCVWGGGGGEKSVIFIR